MKTKDIFQIVRTFYKEAKLRQSSVLLLAMIFAMGINFIASIVVARELGPENYGDVKFIQILWDLLALLSTFGLFHSGSRVLVVEKDPENICKIIGAILNISFLLGISISVLTVVIALRVDTIFNTQVSSNMIRLAPLVFVLSINAALVLILQGTNRIYLLSILNALPALIYLFSIIALTKMHLISTFTVLMSNQVSYLLVILYVIYSLRPIFKETFYWWKTIWEYNKTYGGPVYLGSLANVASSHINRLAISFWVDNTSIGFYSLARSLTEPLKFIPNAVATSSFRSFANQRKITKKIYIATAGFSLLSLIAALLFYGAPLSRIYTKDFAPVSAMARALSIGAIMIGFGDFFNRFLGSHGEGNALRNVAYLVGGVNVAGLFLLVPIWGAWGVIITSVLGGSTYFLFMYRYYLKYINTESQKINSNTQVVEKSEVANAHLGIKNEIATTDRKRGINSKIIILLDSFGFPNGMAATQRVRLISGLLSRNNFQVKVLCVRALEKVPSVINENVRGNVDGVTFEYTPGTTIRSRKFLVRRYFDTKGIVVALARLTSLRLRNQVDCVYYYGSIRQNTINRWVFYLATKILGIPIVTDISEPPWVLNHPSIWNKFLSPIMGVNGVILISDFLKCWVVNESLRHRRKISILQLPILVDMSECDSSAYKVRRPEMSVLFAGTDQATIRFIIQAMEYVWQTFPQCKLIITGMESIKSQDSRLKKPILSSSAKGRAIITGFLPRSDLLNLYQRVSALLIPLFSDIRSKARFPTKLGEYLRSGIPIITSNVGEVKQYLTDGVSAFISDPDNPEKYASKILEAIDPLNWRKARDIGQTGRKIAADHFSVEKFKEPMKTFFTTICDQSKLTRQI